MTDDRNRFDRRRFVTGLGSAALAVPMLESLLPRSAGAQAFRAPKRLLIVYHQDGRLMGDGSMGPSGRNDWWSPAAAGPLPMNAAASPMLAPLQAIRNEIVTIDGIDNLVRHLYSDADNHLPAMKALLTCRKPSGSTSGTPAAASFDYFAGQRLKAVGSTAPASMVMMGTAADETWRAGNTRAFFGNNGTPAWWVHPDPAQAITELFGPPGTPAGRLTGLSLRQRLAAERKSMLDGVLGNFNALRGRVNASDRAKLDAHAQYLRDLERGLGGGSAGGGSAGGGSAGGLTAGGSAGGRAGGGSAGGGLAGGGRAGGGNAGGGMTGGGRAGGSAGGMAGGRAGGTAGGGSAGGGSAGGLVGGGTAGGGGGPSANYCVRPQETNVPSNTSASGAPYLRGERDGQLMPHIIENIVQAFACDVTRVMSLYFWQADDPIFPTQFSGTSPFASTNWHGYIHDTPRIYDDAASRQRAQNLTASFGLYANTFTSLVQRLATMIEPDGTRMLDNTLVLWVSELGYGSHYAANIPVVLSGMRSAFPQGQGRHVVENRRSMGDLLAHCLRILGFNDTTYGETGTLASHGTFYSPDTAWQGSLPGSTPLHSGALNL